MANTKELIAMINGDSLLEAKQHLGKLLAAALPDGGRDPDIMCCNCGAWQRMNWGSGEKRTQLLMFEPRWSNCADCELKY